MKFYVLSACLVLFAIGSNIQAHPGRTASDGCHYCKTNCAKWGVPQGQRHCHYAPESDELGLIALDDSGHMPLIATDGLPKLRHNAFQSP